VKRWSIAILTLMCVGIVSGVFADGIRNLDARLRGFQEVPAVSSTGRGSFEASINREETEVRWELSYANLEGDVLQAHIHFGQRDVNGGISVFLCTNLGNGPAGTQLCPPAPATVSGTFTATDVIGPTAQGIAPGELAELINAIRAGKAYANVHSSRNPGGEIRGQIGAGRSNDDHSGHQ
jgi:hypothetical protein